MQNTNRFEQFKDEIKRDLMLQIMQNVKQGTLGKENTHLVSRDFIRAQDAAQDEQSFLSELFKLIEIHPEILQVFTKHADIYYEQQKNEKITRAHKYITIGLVDEALEALKH